MENNVEVYNVCLENGLNISVKANVLNSWQFMDALYEISEKDNPLKFNKCLRILLGEEQTKKLIESLKDEDGITAFEDVTKAFGYICSELKKQQAQEPKNS